MDDRYNLIYNGQFKNGGDGWNLDTVVKFDSSTTYSGSSGSLSFSGTGYHVYYNKPIQVDTAQTYTLDFDYKLNKSGSSTCYTCLYCYDKYDNVVSLWWLNHKGDSTLAADLNDGDTEVQVTNATGFYENIKNNYNHFGISDSPAWGYNKVLYAQGMVASATNTTTGVIKLNSAWTGGTWKAGTPVAKYRDGATYIYPASWAKTATLGVWNHKTFNVPPATWRYSTMYAKLTQIVYAGWDFNKTNFRFVNQSAMQEREYNGESPSAEDGIANIQKNAVANCNSLHETATKNVRYIRDFCSGSTANNSNHWCEIQAWDKYGRNVAFASIGSAVTRSNVYSNIGSVTKSGVNNSTNANYIKTHAITKGTHSPSSTYIGFGASTGIIIDLGQVFEIETIKIWHYWADGRTYHNVKTEISEDKVNWKTVFDSDVSGEYAESADGLTISFDETTMQITKAGIYKTTELYEV